MPRASPTAMDRVSGLATPSARGDDAAQAHSVQRGGAWNSCTSRSHRSGAPPVSCDARLRSARWRCCRWRSVSVRPPRWWHSWMPCCSGPWRCAIRDRWCSSRQRAHLQGERPDRNDGRTHSSASFATTPHHRTAPLPGSSPSSASPPTPHRARNRSGSPRSSSPEATSKRSAYPPPWDERLGRKTMRARVVIPWRC